MFETTYRIADPGVQIMQSEDGEAYELQIVAPVVAQVPISQTQAALVAMGIVRLPMDKAMVGNLIAALTEGEKSLKARSQIQMAGSMSEAEQLAQMQREAASLRA